jgi:2-(3-amino-3-carboxypropyl)histidine synthase
MKTLFIESESNIEINIPSEHINKLPQEIAIFTTVQFSQNLPKIIKAIEDTGRTVKLLKGRHTQYPGQILGCEFLKYDAEAFLYIGDGKFHPEAIMMQNLDKQVFQFNPFDHSLKELDKTEIERIIKKHKGAIVTFLSKTNIGVIVTTKPGQGFLKRALEFKALCEKKDKNAYLFICDTVDFNQIENFPFVECWVNSACPRIALDDKEKFNKPVVNMEDVWEYVKE